MKTKHWFKFGLILILLVFIGACASKGSASNDTTPPTLSNGQPNGSLVAGTKQTIITLNTDEDASCKYSIATKNVEYADMQNVFSISGGMTHSSKLSGLSDGQAYNFYVRCKDALGNTNSIDFSIAFKVLDVSQATTGFVVNHNNTDLAEIPQNWIAEAKSRLHIAYNHTSHGSQLITGMNALDDYPSFAARYAWVDSSHGDKNSLSLDDRGIRGINDLSNGDRDYNGNGIADWADLTYDFLNDSDNNHINVIMWSWCNIAGHDIPLYLNSMEWLIEQFSDGGLHSRSADYPVEFIFMTAHANGQGKGDSADLPNEQIRAHVAANHRILFDFSDIENYDPDKNYFLDKRLNDSLDYDSDNNGSRDANWASEYLARHDDGELDRLTTGNNVANYNGAGGCAHSDGPNNEARLNCVLKGRAAWYLFARLAGWDGK